MFKCYFDRDCFQSAPRATKGCWPAFEWSHCHDRTHRAWSSKVWRLPWWGQKCIFSFCYVPSISCDPALMRSPVALHWVVRTHSSCPCLTEWHSA